MNNVFKKKNGLAKAWLKLCNPKGYRLYKNEVKEFQQRQFLSQNKIHDVESILNKIKESATVTVLHSGNSGDIIYSLPTLKRIFELTGKKVTFYFKLNQPLNISSHYTHPLGNVMLNEKMAKMLTPLLCSQDYIEDALIYGNQTVHIDLDAFRQSGILVDRGDIARWCSYITGVSPKLYQPWLSINADKAFAETIVISRSERYRNPLLDYSFLNNYQKLVFLGVESEYDDIKDTLPSIEWVAVDDFKRLAEIIAGAQLFIGNQSFPFSVAEGLKVRRILEVFWESPNVIPGGENGYDVMYQNHFEWLVKKLTS